MCRTLGIAAAYGAEVRDLYFWNNLTSTRIMPGQTLNIYPGFSAPEEVEAVPRTTTYRVQSGDNLNRIAARYGTTRQALIELNQLADPNHIVVGQRLQVPAP